ncbi:MAG: hypothetical protein JXR41_13785 [Bacteroidales bacterium]|nr:hypothetical protein [Bacteroidales bacterium]MBN2764158.1 hypothetical protein [Bacteroidales bacterium]
MNKRLFFLKRDGWFEADMTGELTAASIEDLILQAYKIMEQHHYRNYRIMESSPRLFEPPLPIQSGQALQPGESLSRQSREERG